MTITNGYCTLAELKARLDIATADTDDDTILEAIITAVSRHIDNVAGRWFFSSSGSVADETRYYTGHDSHEFISPDDIISLTTIATDGDGDGTYEDTWTDSDYNLLPYNASSGSSPYTSIETSEQGDYWFPEMAKKGIKLTGKFGYALTAPTPIKEACLLQCERLFKRKDAVFGVVGGGDMGMNYILKLDPDVVLLLDPYVKWC